MNKTLILIFILILSSCSFFGKAGDEESRNLLDKHSIRQLRFWKHVDEKTSLEDKIQDELSSEVRDFVKIWLESKKIPQNYKRPKPLISPKDFPEKFKQALKQLPKQIKANMNKRLKGIFLIDGIGASIFTLQLRDENGPVDQFVVFCDKEILNQSINSWYKWRELTAFAPQKPYDIEASLSKKEIVQETIQYAALQLYAIMLSFDARFYPLTRRDMILNLNKYPLLKSSWKIENETMVSIFNEHEEANNLSFIRYYSKDNTAFTLARLSNYYAFLEETNFVNLYAFMGPSRDFVESIANYIYVVKLGNPFKVTFTRGDEILRAFTSCWKNQRCQTKAKLIEKLINQD